MRLPIVTTALLLSACANVEPAPEDLDGLIHWYWRSYDDAPDHDILASLQALAAVAEASGIDDKAASGSVTDLTASELEPVGMTHADPSLAAGFWLLNGFDCTLAELEPILYHLQQDQLYQGAYEAYQRAYTSDFDAYVARTDPTLDWQIALTATDGLGGTFHEQLLGGIRHVPGGEPVLLLRTWMPEPAVYDRSNRSFDQDYQIEVFWEPEPGRVWHLYALWRQIVLGAGLTTDDDIVVATILNNLEKWDAGTAQICADGLP